MRILKTPVSIFLVVMSQLMATRGTEAAEIELRRVGDGQEQVTTTELGEVINFEVFIDPDGEAVTGYSFFISFDSNVFGLVPKGPSLAAGGKQPLGMGPFLGGIVLLNEVRELEGQIVLSYSQAASVQRSTATEPGVAATFAVEVLRRPLGDLSRITIEQRGHDQVSHYVTADSPGTEKRFSEPLGSLDLRIKGFRIMPLPDLELVEGESADSLILDNFIDQEGAQVVWSSQALSQLQTTILPEQGNKVVFRPRIGSFGTHPNRDDSLQIVFTAFEMNEGLTASDTMSIVVRARPVIDGLPATIEFPEDEIDQRLDLDAFVTDADQDISDLIWRPTQGVNIAVEVDSQTHVATLRPAADWFGQESISLTVTDQHGLSAQASVVVSVTPVNDPPQALRHPPVYPVSGGESVAVPLTELVADVDDANLNIMPVSEPGVLALIENGALVIRGVDPGRSVIKLEVSDLDGEKTTTRVVAVVLEPGGTVKPKIAPLPDLQFKNGDLGELDLEQFVSDDGAVSALTWTPVAPDELPVVSILSGILTVGAADGFSGTSKIELTVRDPDGNEDRVSLSVTVLEPAASASPVILTTARIGIVSAEEGKEHPTVVDLDGLVVDADDDDMDIAWEAEVSNGVVANVEGTTLTLNAIEGLFGTGTLNLKATDPQGNFDNESLELLIVEPGAAPRIALLDPIVVDSLDAVVRIDLDRFVFDDVDLPSELVWKAEPDPGVVIELDPATHVLTVRREDPLDETPLSSSVQLEAIDTDGKVGGPVFLKVGLPPVFELTAIPDIEFFTGDTDTSLILGDHVVEGGQSESLDWANLPSRNLDVFIEPVTNRVHLRALQQGFVGGETLLFTATDKTDRTRTAAVRVSVKSRGLAPEIRPLARLDIAAAESDSSIDLDEIVIDDDGDAVLSWSFFAPPSLTVTIDSTTNVVTILADSNATGTEQIQFLVTDPAGNTDLGVLEVKILRGGEPPAISELPQVFLAAGVGEVRLSLDLFVTDSDTPDEQIEWRVITEAGVSARIEGRQLFIAVPAGQAGSRLLELTASDPQGNEARAELTVLIESDSTPPSFAIEVRRHQVFPGLLEIAVKPSEELMDIPSVTLAGRTGDVTPRADDGSFTTTYSVPPVEGPQFLLIVVQGTDLAGNAGSRELLVTLQRMDESGGSLTHSDGLLSLNVPDAVAAPGRLAIIYLLGEEEQPVNSEGEDVYFVDLAGETSLQSPLTLNLFRGGGVSSQSGLLRRNTDTGIWDEQPTVVDESTGWLTITITESGLYRPGTVSETNTRATQKLASNPNPFPGEGGGGTQVEYELSLSGPVRLQVFNILGQRVKILVDEEFQEAGVWAVLFDGRDDDGRLLSNGVYFYELIESGARNCRRILLLR